MTTEPGLNPCPDAEILAAFAEGRLSGARRDSLITHLDACEECMTEVALAIRAHAREGNVSRFRRSGWRIAAAAAAFAVVLAGGLLAGKAWRETHRPPIARLVALAPRSARVVEPRLTGGFAWAAYHGGARAQAEPVDAEQMKLTGVAGELIDRASHDPEAEAQHAAGVALVLVDQPLAAITRLEALAAASNDAKVWSDLAAARYAAAGNLQRTSLYPLALAAADRALRIDPALAEALFNRALILERMRLTAEARRAWMRYLEVDRSSPWATEAQTRVARLPVRTTSRFVQDRQGLELAATRGDLAGARTLAKGSPESARTFAETEFLGRWGEALARGDAVEGERLLSVARAIGDALAQTSGESLLRDTVAAIDGAADAENRTMLADGHALYRRARIAYSRHEIVAAGRDLRSAAALLERAGDPMALTAAYYAASARLAAGDVPGARAELERLRTVIDARPSFIALGARVRWELGRAYQMDDDPQRAVSALGEGASMFRKIGEHTSAALMETLLAGALDSTGKGDDGWNARIRAFAALGADGDPVLLTASLGAARRAELLAGRREAALALARLESSDEHSGGRAADRLDSLVQRGLLEAAAGDDDAAMQSARAAEAVAASFADPAARKREEADAAVAAGAARLRREPRAAIASLTRAIDFYRTHQLNLLLPEPLLLRARAARALGDPDAAARDLEQGMRAVEHDAGERARLGGGVFDAEHALFEDAIRLALDRRDSAGAFAIAERARGGVSTIAQVQQLLAGTASVVLEIATLPEEVVTFAISSRDASVSRRARTRDSLALLAEECLAENGTRAAAALYDDVIRPAEPLLTAASEVIVVPDRALQTAPFAALYDSVARKYFVERYPVTVAASASVLGRRPWRPVTSLAAVALASGSSTQTRGLPAAGEEIDDITPLYARASALPHGSAFRSLHDLDADVIHIAGHTQPQAGGGEQALLFGDGERTERVSWKTIAAAPVRADVVVLAACETLRPAASAATRAPSLGAAFAAAGALDVVGTLSTIPDHDARLLFRAIHRGLAAGAGAAEAVRAAQLEAIRGKGPRAWRTVAVLTRRIQAPISEKETAPWAN